MAFERGSSRCPICSTIVGSRLDAINDALEPMVERVRLTGDVPATGDTLLNEIAAKIEIAPSSLRFHIKECLVQADIQDQRVHELRDLVGNLQVAKLEYASNPDKPQNGQLYLQFVDAFTRLSKEVEGQVDPEVTVQFMISNVIAPFSRDSILTVADEIRELRATLAKTLPASTMSLVDSQFKGMLAKLGNKISEKQKLAMEAVGSYYKVELSAAEIKRSLSDSISKPVADARTTLAEKKVLEGDVV